METKKLTGIERIAAERLRQIEVEGWTPEHDLMHTPDELEKAAACYTLQLGYCPENDRQHPACRGKIYTQKQAIQILKEARAYRKPEILAESR